MTKYSEKAEARKKQIIEAFYEVAGKEGLDKASLAKVAAQMDIHPSLIIHYFKNKNELVVATVRHITSRYEETYLPLLETIKDPEKRIRFLIETTLSWEWARFVDPGVYYSCYSLGLRNEAVQAEFQKMYEKLRQGVVRELRSAIKQGVIEDIGVNQFADFMIVLLDGFHAYGYMADNDARFKKLGKQLTEYLWQILRGEMKLKVPGGK